MLVVWGLYEYANIIAFIQNTEKRNDTLSIVLLFIIIIVGI